MLMLQGVLVQNLKIIIEDLIVACNRCTYCAMHTLSFMSLRCNDANDLAMHTRTVHQQIRHGSQYITVWQ